jgi:hypothetical protein
MEGVAKSWNTTSIALLAIAYVTVPFREFSDTEVAAILVVAGVVLVPLILAAIAHRNPGRTVHGAYFMNLAVSLLAGALAITLVVAVGSAAAVPSALLALVVVTPTMLNFWVLRRRRAQPARTEALAPISHDGHGHTSTRQKG